MNSNIFDQIIDKMLEKSNANKCFVATLTYRASEQPEESRLDEFLDNLTQVYDCYGITLLYAAQTNSRDGYTYHRVAFPYRANINLERTLWQYGDISIRIVSGKKGLSSQFLTGTVYSLITNTL